MIIAVAPANAPPGTLGVPTGRTRVDAAGNFRAVVRLPRPIALRPPSEVLIVAYTADRRIWAAQPFMLVPPGQQSKTVPIGPPLPPLQVDRP